MTKNNEFDKDFDFEKEYGFDPKTLLDPEYENEEAMQMSFDASLDEDFIKDFDTKFDEDFEARFTAEFGKELKGTLREESSEELDAPIQEDEVDDILMDVPQYTEPAFDLASFDESIIDQSAFEAAAAEDSVPVADEVAVPAEEVSTEEAAPIEEEKQEETPAPKPIRKPLSRERMIKEVYLPPIIAGITALLCLIFILSGSVRMIKTAINDRKDAQTSAENEASEKTRLQQESERLLKEAAVLAAGYDYQGAVDKLNSFSDVASMDQYPGMIDARAEYAALKDQLQAWNEPSSIANLSFQILVYDTDRAFTDKELGKKYMSNFVTVKEFKTILEQLYNNGYVLVDFDSFVTETTSDDGTTTYGTTPIYLPSGKKPIMLTQTMVNYMAYMTHEDTEDEDSEYGDGFANKLVVQNGEITCEYYDANGNVSYGSYDFIPILNDFLEEHPDFAYKGARAIIALTGEEGLFGYRTMPSVVEPKGQSYYDEQVAGAKEVAAALRSQGYTIASYTYGNENYKEFSATDIQGDMDLWVKEVTPILGEVNMIVFAQGSDISTGTNYTGNKYRVLADKGFRYFIGASEIPWAEVNTTYVRQTRLMVTGGNLNSASTNYTSYFDTKSVLDNARSTN